MTAANKIAERYSSVLNRIGEAALRSGRDPDDVRLVVVSKGQPIARIRRAVEAGIKSFGENYVEEAVPKIESLAEHHLHWEMIGHVQSRKSKQIAGHFDFLHSLDSVKLARRIHTAREPGDPLPALVQVNVSGEASKFGIPGWDREHLPAIQTFIRQIREFTNLRLGGLMTVPPFLPQDEVRQYFKKLADLGERLQASFPDLHLGQLSMGMSGDFEAAVEEGATIVRIGTAILGPR